MNSLELFCKEKISVENKNLEGRCFLDSVENGQTRLKQVVRLKLFTLEN